MPEVRAQGSFSPPPSTFGPPAIPPRWRRSVPSGHYQFVSLTTRYGSVGKGEALRFIAGSSAHAPIQPEANNRCRCSQGVLMPLDPTPVTTEPPPEEVGRC